MAMVQTSPEWNNVDVEEQVKLFKHFQKKKSGKNSDDDVGSLDTIDREEQVKLMKLFEKKKKESRKNIRTDQDLEDYVILEKPQERNTDKEEKYLGVVAKELADLLGVEQNTQMFQVAMKLVSFLRQHSLEDLEKATWFKMLSPLLGKQIKVFKMIKILGLLKSGKTGKSLKVIQMLKKIKSLHKTRDTKKPLSISDLINEGKGIIQTLLF